MLDNDTLKKTQSLQLKIAKEFKRVCDKNKISYSLSGGSLLGAVRHSGFIPWDDDFDVEMLRCEYERFINIAPYELDADYFLETWETDKHFSLPYAKLMLKNTTYAEKITEKASVNKNIFIDIFIADSVFDNILLQNLQCSICDNLIGILCKKNHYLDESRRKGIKKIIYNFFCLDFISIKYLQKILIFFATICNKSSNEYTSLFGSCYGSKKEIKAKDHYYNLKNYVFEDTQFTGFANFDSYLTKIYGNYMEFPLEEERYDRHGIIKIDFGNY